TPMFVSEDQKKLYATYDRHHQFSYVTVIPHQDGVSRNDLLPAIVGTTFADPLQVEKYNLSALRRDTGDTNLDRFKKGANTTFWTTLTIPFGRSIDVYTLDGMMYGVTLVGQRS